MGSMTLMREQSGPNSLLLRHVRATWRDVSQIGDEADVVRLSLKCFTQTFHTVSACELPTEVSGHSSTLGPS